MAIQGLRTTTNFATDERPQNWREGILLRYPNGNCPLFALTAAMKTRKVDDPDFNWWEKEMQTRAVALNANLTSGAGTATVVSGGKTLKAGDILWSMQTDEQMRVTADGAVDTIISLERGFAGTTATAITYNGTNINPNLYVIGNVNEEGSAAPTGIGFTPTKVTNYTQIFRDNLEATRTALKTRLRTGDQAKEAKRECLEIHSAGIEKAFWLGKGIETTINGKPARQTKGIKSFISTNVWTWGTTNSGNYLGGTKFQDLENLMRLIFQFGSNEKMVFTGDYALMNLQQLIRNAKGIHWDLRPDKEFGMDVTRVTCPFGSAVFKNHPLFTQIQGGTTGGGAWYGLNSWMFFLDMGNIKYCPFQDDDTKYLPDQQDNGVDGLKSGYLTEAGLEVDHEKTHGLIKNFTAFTAE